MDADGLPIVGSTIDMTKVGGINQKRMLAFLNHFIIHTSHFLNRLSCVCEEKLAGLALRIQQIETSMSILEAKLASIPGLDDLRPEPEDSTLTPSTEGAPEYHLTKHTPNETSNTAGRSDVVGEDSPAAENVVTVARDARYARYLKMLQVGVPLMAIRNKMITEGLDPDLLQTPDAPVPSGGEAIKSEPAPEGNDSDSEYSLSD